VVIEGSDGQPQALDLVLDDTLGTKKQFSKGPVIAFSLPLVVLKNGAEFPAAATLNLTATCNGAADCLTGTVTGIPGTGTTPPSAAQLGIQFDSRFDVSPNATTAHRIYELQIPIIATLNNDPAYFSDPLSCPNGNGTNPLSGYCNAFSEQSLGFLVPFLGSGTSIGVAPYAAPLCTAATCPAGPGLDVGQTTYFGFCGNFVDGPAVATFLQIGTDGKTVITSPVVSARTRCPS
jgi:hypothetical protein